MDGSPLLPRMCNSIQSCPIRFDLHADESLRTNSVSAELHPPNDLGIDFCRRRLRRQVVSGKGSRFRETCYHRLVIRNLVHTVHRPGGTRGR